MSELSKLFLPPTLPYPLVVTAVLVRVNYSIERHSTILKYKYWETIVVPQDKLEPDEVEKYKDEPKTVKMESIGTFETPIKGRVTEVNFTVGDEYTSENYKNNPILVIEEPCGHSVQFGGLCGICGADLSEEADYGGGYNRAPIQMSHETSQVTVSMKEAEEIETKYRKKLMKEKKLILVVDLDQTVIQTINDPTVYAWQQDPTNPNHEAVKDVFSFSLKEQVRDANQNFKTFWYYVKIRPGLQEFLAKVSKKYEMHIYTMATRKYAQEIAKIIDPTAEYFGDRILSRDESGSITHKSLKRLFPTNTSMVVIIDDRADVWQWSPNLVKVVPYDFFIGVGDINSSFLPKQHNTIRPSKKRKVIEEIEDKYSLESQFNKENDTSETQNGSDETSKADEDNDSSSDSSDSSDSEAEAEAAEKAAEQAAKKHQSETKVEEPNEVLEEKRNNYLTVVENDRILAKLQKKLDEKMETTPGDDKKGHTLLFDDDEELPYLGDILLSINDRFYEEYESDKKHPPDVANIIPDMKAQVLADCNLLFTGVFPINGSNSNEPELVLWTRSFGANIYSALNSKITHIITFEGKTAKARLGKTLLGDKVKIVHPDWLFACFSKWQQCETKEFEIPFDSKDLVPQSEIENMKQTYYLSDEEQKDDSSLKLIGNLDFTGMDQELEDFLDSDSDGSDEDDEDDDDEDEDNGNDNNNDDDDDDDNSKPVGNVSHKRPRAAISDVELNEKLKLSNQQKEQQEDDDFAAELELELESEEE